MKLALNQKKIGFVILSSDGQKILIQSRMKKIAQDQRRKNLAKDTT